MSSVKIDEAMVRHVARLARLRLDDQEVDRLAVELSAIVDYVDQLNGVDTAGVPPTAHALPLSNVWRGDEVTPSLPIEVALRNAPQDHHGFFRVPKVLDQESA